MRAVRAAQRELQQDDISRRELQDDISRRELWDDEIETAETQRCHQRRHQQDHDLDQDVHIGGQLSAAAAHAASHAHPDNPAAATTSASPSSAYATPRTAQRPDWHAQWCASDYSGLEPALAPQGLSGEQQQHWSPQLRGA